MDCDIEHKSDIDNKIVVVVAYGCQFVDNPIEGSLIRNCSKCGIEVWIAPSWKGKKIDKIWCMNCYEKFDKDKKNEEVEIVITEEMMKEFNDNFKKRYGYIIPIEELIKVIEKNFGRKVVYKGDVED